MLETCGCPVEFLSTPSARRATRVRPPAAHRSYISIHALREEGDTSSTTHSSRCSNFYPRPPRGGRPVDLLIVDDLGKISIHALREEGDSWCFTRPASCPRFLSTPSARRATEPVEVPDISKIFLSTPSARRATADCRRILRRRTISIHALREEGDRAHCCTCLLLRYFYPRPPRGGRRRGTGERAGRNIFLSTPSARRATFSRHARRHPKVISIHALREEGDSKNRDKISIFKQIIQHSARI